MYHTHPGSTGPSDEDAELSSVMGIPFYVLGMDNRVWEAERVPVNPGKPPLIRYRFRDPYSSELDKRNPPYGKLINDINLIR